MEECRCLRNAHRTRRQLEQCVHPGVIDFTAATNLRVEWARQVAPDCGGGPWLER